MSAEEAASLKEDLSRNGIQMPIVIYDGKILDGRHRYEAALSLGLAEEDIPIRHLGKNEDPLTCVISSNFNRRHLNTSQRALIAAGLSQEDENISINERARTLNISIPMVYQASKILENGSSEIIKSIETGEITVSDANKVIGISLEKQNEALEIVRNNKTISNLKKAVQHINRKEAAEKAAEKAKTYENSNRCKIYQCSVKDLSFKIEKNSIDVILTDPPYPSEFLHCWDELGDFAMHALREGGSLVAMSGQAHFADIASRLRKAGLSEYWILCYNMPGVANQISYRAISNHWKPVIWMTKGKAKSTKWSPDIITVPKLSKQENELHQWQQQEEGWQMLTDAVVSVGDVVCDPFLGSGTSAVCAWNAGCFFIGSDIEQECVDISKERFLKHEEQFSKQTRIS